LPTSLSSTLTPRRKEVQNSTAQAQFLFQLPVSVFTSIEKENSEETKCTMVYLMFGLVLSILLLSLSPAYGHGELHRNRHLRRKDQQGSVSCGTPDATDEQRQAAGKDIVAWRKAEQTTGSNDNIRRLTEHRYDIDMWFHFVAPDSASADRVTDALVAEYLVEFNKAFQGTAFQFVLAGRDTTVNEAWSNSGRDTPSASRQAMQVALNKGGSDTMNVYFDNTANAGLATVAPGNGGFPGGTDFNST
jgi:hypothetical protein